MVGEQKMIDREGMAKWYAQRHLKTDEAVLEIHYLPEDAPDGEIRFVEVNKLISESTPMEPIDFGVDQNGTGAHTLYVLDVTPSQWDAIRAGKLKLPPGWTLNKSVSFGRK
jgi:hypothetical protein